MTADPQPANSSSLLADIRGCRLCAASLPLGPRPVVQLHPAAKILIAGQAPGARVHKTGIPFDDPSGDRLRRWLGITREDFYDDRQIAILPMGFCYPGRGKSGDLPPLKLCAATWRERALTALPEIQLTVVIGQYAMQWHLDNPGKNLTDSVRNWRDFAPAMFPIPHPSPRNNIWLKKNEWFEAEVLPALQKNVQRLLGEVNRQPGS